VFGRKTFSFSNLSVSASINSFALTNDPMRISSSNISLPARLANSDVAWFGFVLRCRALLRMVTRAVCGRSYLSAIVDGATTGTTPAAKSGTGAGPPPPAPPSASFLKPNAGQI
jgi:hypothetical protein